MSPLTLPRFLLGDRKAILDLAATRWTLLIGGLFVLSAGLAREYDGADLLHEPWHLLIPFGSSLVACAVLFFITFLFPLGRTEPARIGNCFLAFLGLFWLTAPLAWVYAIPFERFMDEDGALIANFSCLGLVSLWRVALMTRIIVVLTGCRWWGALGRVMLFAAAVLAVAAFSFWWLHAQHVLDVMAGTRASPSEQMRADLGGGTGCWSSFLFVCLLGGNLMLKMPPASQWPWVQQQRVSATRLVPWSLILIALGCVVIGAALLPFAQVEQQNRWQAEAFWEEEKYGEAVAYLSARQRDNFPPHWRPPPSRIKPSQWRYDVDLQVRSMEEVFATPRADWVNEHFVQVLAELLEGLLDGAHWPDEPKDRLATLIESIPDGPALAERHLTSLEREWRALTEQRERESRYRGKGMPDDSNHALNRLIRLAKGERGEPVPGAGR
jgi:hypothetical protein